MTNNMVCWHIHILRTPYNLRVVLHHTRLYIQYIQVALIQKINFRLTSIKGNTSFLMNLFQLLPNQYTLGYILNARIKFLRDETQLFSASLWVVHNHNDAKLMLNQ